MRSQEGSTDSSAIKLRSHAMVLPPLFSFTPTKVKTEEEVNEPIPRSPPRRRMSTRATSTVTSSSVEAPSASRRSERTRTTSIKTTSSKEKETIVNRAKTRDKNERKRYYEESDSEDDVVLSQYRECREKNNEASRRSRMNKKAKESEMTIRAVELERDNKVLKMKVEELEKLVTSMRNALLRSALKGVF